MAEELDTLLHHLRVAYGQADALAELIARLLTGEGDATDLALETEGRIRQYEEWVAKRPPAQ